MPEAGRAALDRALDAIYPTERDFRMGLLPVPGESEPALREVVAYRAAAPQPHWHYISYGLSELDDKVSDNPEVSGFGIELTLRLDDDRDEPAPWPVNFLRWLAGTVWNDRSPFGDGHSMPLDARLLEAVSPGVEGLAFRRDRALGSFATSNGRLTCLEVLPLTADEYALFGRWDATAIFAEMQREDPSLLWRIGRRSILAGPRAAEILERADREGSAQEMDFTGGLSWTQQGIVLDAINRFVVHKFLRYRVRHGRHAIIVSEGLELRLQPGPFALRIEGAHAVASVPPDRAQELAEALAAGRTGDRVSLDQTPMFVLGDLDLPLHPSMRF